VVVVDSGPSSPFVEGGDGCSSVFTDGCSSKVVVVDGVAGSLSKVGPHHRSLRVVTGARLRWWVLVEGGERLSTVVGARRRRVIVVVLVVDGVVVVGDVVG
jgi:hypothetical protein